MKDLPNERVLLLIAFAVAWCITCYCGGKSEYNTVWLYIEGGLGFAMGRDIGLKLADDIEGKR